MYSIGMGLNNLGILSGGRGEGFSKDNINLDG